MICQVDTVTIKNDMPIPFIEVSDPWHNPVTILAITSIGIAILALLSPIIIQWISEKIRLSKLKNIIKYFLERIIVDLKQFISHLNHLKEQIRDTSTENFKIPLLDDERIQSLAKIDIKDIFTIFIDNQSNIKESSEHISSILDLSEFLRTNELLQKNLSHFLQDLRRYDEKFKENVNYIYRGYEDYLSKEMVANNDYENDEFLIKFRDILRNWRQINDRDRIEVIKSDLLDKLKSHCTTNLNHQESTRFIKYITDANDAYSEITNIRDSYVSYIETNVKSVESDLNHLIKAISYYYE